jgi:hypothetical protein
MKGDSGVADIIRDRVSHKHSAKKKIFPDNYLEKKYMLILTYNNNKCDTTNNL